MTEQQASFLRRAIAETSWDFGNQVLYEMCRANPDHKKDEVIIGKIWLIGRSYAAAIERRTKVEGAQGDAFYETKVAPTIRNSGIDSWFEKIRSGDEEDVPLHLEIHWRVTDLFKKISKLEKRSLASKYLHFHLPERFYIYDSRAQTVISKLTEPVRKLPLLVKHDPVYARVFRRAHNLRKRFASLLGQPLSPREFDKVLLAYSRLLPSDPCFAIFAALRSTRIQPKEAGR
jgi:hypothetical protein